MIQAIYTDPQHNQSGGLKLSTQRRHGRLEPQTRWAYHLNNPTNILRVRVNKPHTLLDSKTL